MGGFLVRNSNRNNSTPNPVWHRITVRRVINPITIEKYLQTYSLEEIFELNELTQEEVLLYLVEQEFIELPTPSPVDLDDD